VHDPLKASSHDKKLTGVIEEGHPPEKLEHMDYLPKECFYMAKEQDMWL